MKAGLSFKMQVAENILKGWKKSGSDIFIVVLFFGGLDKHPQDPVVVKTVEFVVMLAVVRQGWLNVDADVIWKSR